MGVVTEPDGPTIENMRKRAEQCRRLASAILDRRTADALIKLAEEVEAAAGEGEVIDEVGVH